MGHVDIQTLVEKGISQQLKRVKSKDSFLRF